jgi:hypothetical protein
MKLLILILLIFISGFCSRLSDSGKEKPLAQVGKEYLYPSDLNGLIKQKLTKDDSIAMVAGLVEKWIRKQLILQKAELNLSDDEKNVKRELDEYRTSLLIFKYEQKLVREKLDTVVDQKEKEKYYNENMTNFKLNYDVVKVHYVKLPLHAPNIESFRTWFRAEEPESIKQLEVYCFQHAAKYDYFNDEWVNFNNIKTELPIKIYDNEQFLKSYKYYEIKDSVWHYFLNIKDFQLKGSISPLKFVENDIRSIILLKRKQKLISDLENKIYFDALNHSSFKIYEKK